MVGYCLANPCPDTVGPLVGASGSETGAAPPRRVPPSISLGEIRTTDLSLPVLTIVLGALDGFNPCAMWVLAFLIGLLLGMQDHFRVWTLGAAFMAESRFWLALAGILAPAFAVNLVELLCSAGIPAVYTQVLALSKLPAWQYYAYLALYILVFMLEAYDVDMPAMLRKARRRSIAVELNAHPGRLDLSDAHFRMAKDEGVIVAISSDAHSADGLDMLRYGVGQARRGWLEKKDVLNARPLTELRRLVAPAVRAAA